MNMKYSLIISIFIFLISCKSDDNSEPDYTAQNEQEILAYIEDNNLVAEKSDSGLYYVVNEVGTGSQPDLESNITVAYRGYFTNGNVFDRSSPEGVVFDLRQLISGFAEGVTYFREGGSGVLLIPSRLAYGNNGSGPVPPGAVILFDVKLISVN